MIGEHKIRVRYEETDQMGVVYYGNYFTWFEVGRAELLRTLGYTYREMEQMGVFLPVIEAGCQYKSPARYDDLLTISTTVSKLTGVRIVFDYIVYSQERRVIVKGFTTHAFVNADGQLINVSKKSPEIWQIVKKLTE